MKKFLISIILVLVVIFGVLIYSRFIGVRGLDTNEIVINTNISEGYDGLKIVHFSDLHYKKVITEKRVKELVSEINKINPDMVMFTGDLLDKDYTVTNSDINFLIEQLSSIKTKYGIFAVMGDNDYSNEEVVNNIYIQSDVTLLKNTSTVIYNENNENIYIGGLDSFNLNKADIDILDGYNEIDYKMILVHEGDYVDNVISKINDVDMILSGHSMNGSINVLGIKNLLLSSGSKKYYKPYYKINNTDIYISNGIGVDKVNFRLFNTPSINFYRFDNDNY